MRSWLPIALVLAFVAPLRADVPEKPAEFIRKNYTRSTHRIAMRDGTAAERLGAAVWTFASRALRGRRLAYSLVAEPVEPDVEAMRLTYHRALARVFKTIIEQGMADGEFPAQDAMASADCIVGCLFEGLVVPLTSSAAPDAEQMSAHVTAIITFCLRGVSGSQVLPVTVAR